MRVIVSKSLNDNFEKYKVVKKLAEVKEMSGVETVILRDFGDNIKLMGGVLNAVSEKHKCNFFYLCENLDSLVKLWVEGLGGKCFEGDFYFDSENELDALIDVEYSDSTELVLYNDESLRALEDFVKVVEENEAISPYFINKARDAVRALQEELALWEGSRKEIGSLVAEMFTETLEHMKQLTNQKTQLEKHIADINAMQNKEQLSPRARLTSRPGASVQFYQPFQYNVKANQRVLVVREYSPCRYLTSFLLAYKNYLQVARQKRTKLIFVVQKGSLIYKKYDNADIFSMVKEESIANHSVYEGEIIVTDIPQKTVMNTIFEESSQSQVIIVVDRTYGNTTIVQGNGVKNLNAVSGATDLDRYKLKADTCIFPVVDYKNCFLSIPTVAGEMGYPVATEPDKRQSAYVAMNKKFNIFGKMDKHIGIEIR